MGRINMTPKASKMSDINDPGFLTEALKYLGYAFVGLWTLLMTGITFFFKREIAKIDDLQKNTIKRPEFEHLFEQVMATNQEVKDGRAEFRSEHKETREKVSDALSHFDEQHNKTRDMVHEALNKISKKE